MRKQLRVAFFPDSYLEVNGAAMTCRRLVEFAGQNDRPLLCVHAGRETSLISEGSLTHLSLKRSKLAITLDEDLAYDPVFQRHMGRVRRELIDFGPDVIHITGLNDVSIIGVYLGWKLGLPVLGSWHTNLHEFAASRLERMLSFLPAGAARSISRSAKKHIMNGAALYYRIPQVILAPNTELVDELARRTGRLAQIMGRGVDTEIFSPQKRTVTDGSFRFGFVGRLRAEKNVRMLVDIERALLDAGKTGFKFLIVGEGTERRYLESNMKTAEFTGFLDGEQLASAYANMDVFLFPSETDTFGNVSQEAHASGVPVIVSDKGGPKYTIREGQSGFIARDLGEFVRYSMTLMDDRETLDNMKAASRSQSLNSSWPAVFESVYDGYEKAIRIAQESRSKRTARMT